MFGVSVVVHLAMIVMTMAGNIAVGSLPGHATFATHFTSLFNRVSLMVDGLNCFGFLKGSL